MTSALTKSLETSRAMVNTVEAVAMRLKGSGILNSLVSPAMMGGAASDWQQSSRQRENYAQFRSWVYSAVHALAGYAAFQPVSIGRVVSEESAEKRRLSGVKASPRKVLAMRRRARQRSALLRKRMTKSIAARVDRAKDAGSEMDLLPDHPLAKILERPNPLQHRMQFVYSFVANLALTGRCYVIRDKDDDGGLQYYCLPSTWVRPDRSEWPKMKYYVANPRNLDATGQGEPLGEDQVAVAYLPNPADPLGCMSPASSQSAAIRVDDRIQTVQEKFFDNGIFPSVVVTVGKDPHPDVPGGIRPRLSAQQRRQVIAAIRRTMGSVANYGNPAIVDGLIEAITPFSLTQKELGWDKSEDKIKDRILCAFGVHPLMIGQALNVGGHAQAYVIKTIFCDRVNMYLDLLSTLMTEFAGGGKEAESEEELVLWWEKAEAVDASIESMEWNNARQRGDVTKNENRARLGLPPDEDSNEQELPDASVPAVAGMLAQAGIGQIRSEQVRAVLVANGLSDESADAIAGVNLPPQDQGGFGDFGQPPADDQGWEYDQEAEGGGEALAGALQGAAAFLRADARKLVEQVTEAAGI